MTAKKLIRQINTPAPKWFLRLKRALTLFSDTLVVILLSLGYMDNSLIILICRVGVSGVLESAEALLVDEHKNDKIS